MGKDGLLETIPKYFRVFEFFSMSGEKIIGDIHALLLDYVDYWTMYNGPFWAAFWYSERGLGHV